MEEEITDVARKSNADRAPTLGAGDGSSELARDGPVVVMQRRTLKAR
jgi:hypothetical protein